MIEKVNGWWITGLVDGEGCFHASIRMDTRYPTLETLHIGFQIGLVQDDVATLEKVRLYFGTGTISLARDRRPYAQDRMIYRMYRRSEFEKVIEHFEKYPLQSKKQKDYECWKEILRVWAIKGLKDKKIRVLDKERGKELVARLKSYHTKRKK